MRYILCSFVFTISLIFLPLPKSIRHGVIEYGFYLFYALIAGLLPISFYLDRKRKRSSTEPTVADAS